MNSRATVAWATLCAMGVGGFSLTAGSSSEAADRGYCTSACLNKFLDEYLVKLPRHDATGLKVANEAEIRGNTIRVRLGAGESWSKISQVSICDRFEDPKQFNIVARCAVQTAGGKVASLSVRLQTEGMQLVEVETSFNQGTGPFDAANLLEPDVLWRAPVPPSRRIPREAMIHVADAYFDAISRHDESASFGKRCDRFESGKKMTNNPSNASNESGAVSCGQSLLHLTGQQVVQRRFPLVDEERGVVLGYGFILHGERSVPNSTGLAEVFKIADGKIRAIENIETVVSYPPDGGFDSRSAPVPAAYTPVAATTAAGQGACDAGCLDAVMRQYLDHLTQHTVAGLPLADPMIARENSVAVPLGEGVWKTINKVLSRDVASDPVTGATVMYGAVAANRGIGALFVRLKVVDRQITESEIIFNGVRNAFANPENLLSPDIIYDATVPFERRTARAGLVKIIDSYLDGITSHDGSKVPFNVRCDRYASGGKVTNSSDHPAEREGGTCAGSFEHLTGQLVVNRRYPVIDVERGIVVSLFIIPHHERTPPGTTHVGEWFKIVDGQIRSIEEFSFGGGWPPDSGFEGDVETGTPDTPRSMNMHPSPELLQKILSGPRPVMSIDNPITATNGAPLIVHSATLDAAGYFPIKNTGWGESISPAVSWTVGPHGTKSYALIMEDGTAGINGLGVLHWLAFNIPPDTNLSEGLALAPHEMLMGKNQAGDSAYTGPHSPAGGPVFNYHLQVYALDRKLALPRGSSRDQVLEAMRGHILGKGDLAAHFQGPE